MSDLKYLVSLFVIICFSSSCSEDESPEVEDELIFSNLSLTDLGNGGDASDFHLTGFLDGNIESLSSLKLFLIKGEEALDVDAVVASTSFQNLAVSKTLSIQIDSELEDSDSEVVTEDVPYQVIVQGTFSSGETFIEELSSAVMLKNEIVLTTPSLNGNFNATEDIVAAPDGTLYVAGGATDPNSIYKVSPNGESSIFSSGHSNPVGITIDKEGNLYASNFQATTIHKISASGVVSDFISDPLLSGGGGVAIDNDGVLYNAFFAKPTLFRYQNNVLDEFVNNSSFNGPVGMDYDPIEDQLYVSSFSNGKIFSIEKDGTITEIADTPASIGHLAYFNNHFFVTGWNEHKVYQVAADGEIVATLGSGVVGNRDGNENATFTNPNGIAVSPDGKYVYVSQGDGKLRKIILPR